MDLKNVAQSAKKLVSAIQAIPSIPPFAERMIGENVHANSIRTLAEIASSQEMKSKKRKAVLTYSRRTFKYKGKEYPIKNGREMAKLCDFIYLHCPKSDKSVHWEKVYEGVTHHRSQSKLEDQEKVRGWVRSLNRWATDSKRSIGKLVEFTGGYVQRLK
jgi:hypothetical protein